MTLYAASGRSIRAQNAPRGGFNLTPEEARMIAEAVLEHLRFSEGRRAAA